MGKLSTLRTVVVLQMALFVSLKKILLLFLQDLDLALRPQALCPDPLLCALLLRLHPETTEETKDPAVLVLVMTEEMTVIETTEREKMIEEMTVQETEEKTEMKTIGLSDANNFCIYFTWNVLAVVTNMSCCC